ncbi:MAG TPA: DUF6599 family protein [Candidatus Angelobacter sp.]|nr:DUF6599 family protein [Candidatus Angelobacter sp.]
MIKRLSIAAFVLLLTCLGFASTPSILPSSFNGWQLDKSSIRSGSDPASIDGADAAVLNEYGFKDFESGTYQRNGRKMQIKVARFKDATGAFGAFTYYVQPRWQNEDIGDRAASNNRRILFSHSNLLVDATLDEVTAMSAADLRAFANALPKIRGNLAGLPTLQNELPKQSSIPRSLRYIEGPVALERLGVPIPASLVNFTMGPEVVFARYRTSYGEAYMTLIGYPTPQIAADRLKAFQAAHLPGGPFHFKRSGPFVIAVSGNVPENEADSLLASVNYDANVTWDQPTKQNPRDNIGNLIVGIFMLIGVILVVALIFGFAFGGIRVLAKKIFPNRVFDRPEDAEIIQLNLK